MIFNYRIAIDINLNFALVLKEQKANNWKEVNQNERKYGFKKIIKILNQVETYIYP